MDFRQFVTEFFSDRIDRDPSSLINDNMQQLLYYSREQDLDSRQELLDESLVPEDDSQPVEPAGPVWRQEPATDSAFESTPVANEREVLEAEQPSALPSVELPVELTETSEAFGQAEAAPESTASAEIRQAAIPDENMLPVELTESSAPEEELVADSIQFRNESVLLGAEDVPFDLEAAMNHVERDLRLGGDTMSFVEEGFAVPELLPIPRDFMQSESSKTSFVTPGTSNSLSPAPKEFLQSTNDELFEVNRQLQMRSRYR